MNHDGAVLAAVLAALFLLGGLRVGLRGVHRDGGGLAPVGPAELRLFPRPAGKKPDRPKEVQQDRPSGGEAVPSPLLSRRDLLELGRRLFPCCWRWRAVPQKTPDRRAAPAPGGQASDPADAALRYGQANALLGDLAAGDPALTSNGRARVERILTGRSPRCGRVSCPRRAAGKIFIYIIYCEKLSKGKRKIVFCKILKAISVQFKDGFCKKTREQYSPINHLRFPLPNPPEGRELDVPLKDERCCERSCFGL